MSTTAVKLPAAELRKQANLARIQASLAARRWDEWTPTDWLAIAEELEREADELEATAD